MSISLPNEFISQLIRHDEASEWILRPVWGGNEASSNSSDSYKYRQALSVFMQMQRSVFKGSFAVLKGAGLAFPESPAARRVAGFSDDVDIPKTIQQSDDAGLKS